MAIPFTVLRSEGVTSGGGMVSCRFRSTFLSSYNYFWYELCRSNTHCTGN